MEVDSVGDIAILSMSYITTCIVKTYTSVAKIPTVPVENQITTLSVVKIAITFSPCRWSGEERQKCVCLPTYVRAYSTGKRVANTGQRTRDLKKDLSLESQGISPFVPL